MDTQQSLKLQKVVLPICPVQFTVRGHRHFLGKTPGKEMDPLAVSSSRNQCHIGPKAWLRPAAQTRHCQRKRVMPNEKHIPDSTLAKLRRKEADETADRKRRVWQSLKTLAGWVAACSIGGAVMYDTFLRLIGRR